MTTPSFIITPDSITGVIDNETITVHRTHGSYEAVLDAIRENRFSDIPNLVRPQTQVFTRTKGRAEYRDGQVFFDGRPVSGKLAETIVDFVRRNIPIDPLLAFFDKLMNNPSARAREQLYGFIEANKITVNQDGNLVLYKKVRSNYTDVHSGTFDNSIGKTVEMPRRNVDDDPNRTCSYGLHVCSLAYLSHFSGEHTVLVEVDPADVVAIPTDYHNSKMRVSKYKVIGEHKAGNDKEFTSSSFVNTSDWSARDWEIYEAGYDDGVNNVPPLSDGPASYTEDPEDPDYDYLEDEWTV